MNWSCLRRPLFCVDRNGGKSDQKGRGISISLSPLETPLLKTTRGRVCDPCLWTPSPLGRNCFLSFEHQTGKQSVRCGLQSKCCTSLARRPEGGDARERVSCVPSILLRRIDGQGFQRHSLWLILCLLSVQRQKVGRRRLNQVIFCGVIKFGHTEDTWAC